MKRFLKVLGFLLGLLLLIILAGCTQSFQTTSQENSENFPDAVSIDLNKITDIEKGQLAINLPEYDVSTIFSSTFSKPIQYSSLSGNVKLIREDNNSSEEIEIYLSSDRKTIYIKPIFRFIAGNNEVYMKGLKPGLTYKIVISPYIRFDDNSTLGIEKVFRFQTKNLDYGIYWFSPDGKAEKFVPGRANAYFNPSKPSVIYLHGWEKDTTIRDYFREDPYFLITKTIKNVNTGQFWTNKNYNIGVFYWNQFADEGEVKDAEAKIWTYAGPKGMRYRLSNGNYVNLNVSKSVSDLAFECFSQNFRSYSGSEIRIAGHSLGNQLATVLTWKIHKAIESGTLPSSVMPKRLVLLDPFWSKGEKSYLGNKWTGEVARQYVKELISTRRIAVEMYKSSMIGGILVGDENEEMKGMVAFYRLWADFIPTTDQAEQHGYAVSWYFWSMAGAVNGDTYKFGAAVDSNTIKSMMNWDWANNRPVSSSSRRMWYTEGRGNTTPTPLDDYFKVKSGVSTWSEDDVVSR
uniref:Uncharacterized protein n=1 Tax=Fervidobacterium nodosum TaxID=2424 RepID=A0A7C5U5P8_9BACT